jgi:hypothetical protein
LRWWIDQERGEVNLRGRLPDADGMRVVKAIERLAHQAPPDPISGLYEPFESRCADALTDLAGAQLAQDSDPDRATVIVHIEAATGTAELESGIQISTVRADQLLCGCRRQDIFHGAGGQPIGVGRTSREPPRWLERQIRHRDKRHCQFPGCDRTRWIQIHHIRWWTKGGTTDLDNLICLCTYHHRWIHRQGWEIRGKPGTTLQFLRPDGRPIGGPAPPLEPEIRERIFG